MGTAGAVIGVVGRVPGVMGGVRSSVIGGTALLSGDTEKARGQLEAAAGNTLAATGALIKAGEELAKTDAKLAGKLLGPGGSLLALIGDLETAQHEYEDTDHVSDGTMMSIAADFFALGALIPGPQQPLLATAAIGLSIWALLSDPDNHTLHDTYLWLWGNTPDSPPPPEPPRPRGGDPLVLDLGGNGIITTGLDAGIHFDHDGDGFRELSGFVNAEDGLLVLDRNEDGKINDGTELFGDNTRFFNGAIAPHGFAALSELDDNKDGVIDKNDAYFSKLRIFQDLPRPQNLWVAL